PTFSGAAPDGSGRRVGQQLGNGWQRIAGTPSLPRRPVGNHRVEGGVADSYVTGALASDGVKK
ncbi:MAG TPA: hypothetical protein PLX68_07350, partial [Dermatophilaceae bacterium]|nr:hypothetical protein [Dermatophilaceae bacterium]